MNKLWIRISLTFVSIVIFIIVIPTTIGIATRNFPFESSLQSTAQAGETSPEFFIPHNPELQLNNVTGWTLLGGFLRFIAVITFIGIIVGVVSSRGLTAPLNKMAETAKAIGAKDLSQRVEIKGTDEVRAVAKALNEMADELTRAETLRKNLLADVAHELRTPISVIQGSLRAILDDVYDLDKTEIARLYDQTRHLSRLVDDLRDLALADARQLQMNITEMDVVPWVQSTAAAFRPIAAEKDISVRVELLGKVESICADPSRLTQSLHNLLNNAFQNTPPGGTITIQVEQPEGGFYLRVLDTGLGISPEHLPHIFDRFYRVDTARSRESGGTGLGLAITRAFILAHEGDIKAESKGSGKGSQFTIHLPGNPSSLKNDST